MILEKKKKNESRDTASLKKITVPFTLDAVHRGMPQWKSRISETSAMEYVVQRTLTMRGSITVRLNSCLTRLELTKQVKLLFIQQKKAAESKQNKQEVRHTMIGTSP